MIEYEEFVSDWIYDMALKDNGKVFMDDTDEDEYAPITYGDLRKLIKRLEDDRTN